MNRFTCSPHTSCDVWQDMRAEFQLCERVYRLGAVSLSCGGMERPVLVNPPCCDDKGVVVPRVVVHKRLEPQRQPLHDAEGCVHRMRGKTSRSQWDARHRVQRGAAGKDGTAANATGGPLPRMDARPLTHSPSRENTGERDRASSRLI
jgi:hypothetical protein